MRVRCLQSMAGQQLHQPAWHEGPRAPLPPSGAASALKPSLGASLSCVGHRHVSASDGSSAIKQAGWHSSRLQPSKRQAPLLQAGRHRCGRDIASLTAPGPCTERAASHSLQAVAACALGPAVHHRPAVRVHLHPFRDGRQLQQRGPAHPLHRPGRRHVLRALRTPACRDTARMCLPSSVQCQSWQGCLMQSTTDCCA